MITGSKSYRDRASPYQNESLAYGQILLNDLRLIKLNVTQLQHHDFNHVMTQFHEGYTVQREA